MKELLTDIMINMIQQRKDIFYEMIVEAIAQQAANSKLQKCQIPNKFQISNSKLQTKSCKKNKDFTCNIIEDVGLGNAIREGRKNKYVDEKRIMDLLEG